MKKISFKRKGALTPSNQKNIKNEKKFLAIAGKVTTMKHYLKQLFKCII